MPVLVERLYRCKVRTLLPSLKACPHFVENFVGAFSEVTDEGPKKGRFGEYVLIRTGPGRPPRCVDKGIASVGAAGRLGQTPQSLKVESYDTSTGAGPLFHGESGQAD